MSSGDDDEIDAALDAQTTDDPPEAPAPKAKAPQPERLKPGRKPAGTPGLGAPEFDQNDPKSPWPSKYAVDIANDIQRRLTKWNELGSVYELECQLFPMDGAATKDRMIGVIPFKELLNEHVAPGMVLQDIVTTRYHLPIARGPVTYLITFVWSRGGGWYARNATLQLGSPEEIRAIRNANAEPYRYGEGTAFAPTPRRQEPEYPRPQPGYGGAPGPVSRDDDLANLRSELASIRGSLNEALLYARDRSRQPDPAHAQPAGLGAPGFPGPTPSPFAATIAGAQEAMEPMVRRISEESVVGVLRAFGFQPAAAGVAAPSPPLSPQHPAPAATPPAPAPAPKNPLVDGVTRDLENVVSQVVKQGFGMILKSVQDNLEAGIAKAAGLGGPPEDVAEEPPEPEPAEPAPRAPFDLIDAGTKWPDSSPVMYPQDEEGKFSWKGMVFGNPFLAREGMKIVDKGMDVAKSFADRVKLPDGNTVVGRTPRGAVDGTPRPGSPPAPGVGGPPQSPNASPPNGQSKASPPPPRGGGFPAV